MVEIKCDELIKSFIAELPKELNKSNETKIAIDKGFSKLIALLEMGTEIYPSLNRSEYLSEDADGNFQIDYTELQKIVAAKKEKLQKADTKQISNNSKATSEADNTEQQPNSDGPS